MSVAEVSTCENYVLTDDLEPLTSDEITSEIVVRAKEPKRRFDAGLELGLDDAYRLMRARYSYVVGILGLSGVGKTCLLASLYLMASARLLPDGFVFAGSDTLPGFEARARRLRSWQQGVLPETLAEHTHLSDPRQPGFLHLRLGTNSDAEYSKFDLLLSDLPGEWTRDLIDRADAAEKFSFLKRSDAIFLVLDGPEFESGRRHVALQRHRTLIERLVQAVKITAANRVLLVLTKGDLVSSIPNAVLDLKDFARSKGISAEIIRTVAFSSRPDEVANGMGIFETIKFTLAKARDFQGVNDDSEPEQRLRSFHSFGRNI